jgi:hypothetical protein
LHLGYTTPTDGHTSSSQFFFGLTGNLFAQRTTGLGIGGTYLLENQYVKQSTGSFAYTTSAPASRITLFQNQIIFSNAASGTAGDPVSDTERMRIDSSGNVLIGTTSSAFGNFTNRNKSAVLTSDSASNVSLYSFTNSVAASNNATVDALRFLRADGSLAGSSAIAGIVYVRVRGASGGNQYLASYTLYTTGNGTSDSSFTLINSAQTRGTSPVSSVQIANDGVSGAVKVTITYINNAGVVDNGEATVSFVGVTT